MINGITSRDNLKTIKRVIGVYSGKGGVGKTTIAINLAAALAHQGYRVCLLDADIDCPNVTRALGINEELELEMLSKRIIPLHRYNLKVMSFGALQKKEDEAVIWRGPMLTDMLMKFIGNTVWGTTDYLIIDLPPGTSDIPLTIMNTIRPDGIILVTTPRTIAEVDARKSANLAKKTHINILGVIENMSGEIFGTGKGKECAQTIHTRFLGTIPFDKAFMKSVDEGYPAVLEHNHIKQPIHNIINTMQEAEEALLGSRLSQPKKNMFTNTKNFMVDMKDAFADRYKKEHLKQGLQKEKL
jgi:ATP-binding protein involved in chromosome partitioning